MNENASGRAKGMLLIAVLGISYVWSLSAQVLESSAPAFEVATVKLSKPNGSGSSINFDPGRIRTENVSLQHLITFAYHLSSGAEDQLLGGPSWVQTTAFDMEAKEEEAVAARLQAMSQEQREDVMRLMLQRLLADRFKLKVHTEMKERSVNALVVAKGGPRLAVAGDAPSVDAPGKQEWSGLHNSGGQMEGRDVTLAVLTDTLGSQPEFGGRTLVDNTGLTGRYNFKLKWAPEQTVNAGTDVGGPSLFSALQEQLGLKVEARKVPMKIVVIDHVEMPSEN